MKTLRKSRQKKLTAKSLARLAEFIQTKAKGCIQPAEGMLSHPYVTPTYGVKGGGDEESTVSQRATAGAYLQMYAWDSALFAQAMVKLPDFKELPLYVVANFLALQEKESGWLPRTVSPNLIWDGRDLAQPFFAQTLDSYQGNAELTSLIDGLDLHFRYWRRLRGYHNSSLHTWQHALASGVDANFALLCPQPDAGGKEKPSDLYPDGGVLAVDLNSYLWAEYKAMASLARKVGNQEMAERYEKQAKKLAEAIEVYCWNKEHGLYMNFDPATGNQVPIRSWTGLTPVAFGLAQPERARQVIDRNIMDESHFLRPAGLASMAASEPYYNQAKRVLYYRRVVSNWGGPVWVLPTALVGRGLLRYGAREEARTLSHRLVSTVMDDFERSGTMHENYNAETGAPLWAPNFMSWNALLLELIELL